MNRPTRLRVDAPDAPTVWHAIDDFHLRRVLASAADRQVFERGVGGDDEIRHVVRAPLEKQQRAIKESLVPIFHHEQLRPDVVLVVNETLAEKLERRGGEKNKVWRIACLNDGKSALAVDLHEQAELMEERGGVFPKIRQGAASFRGEPMTVDRDVVDDLEFRREGIVRGTDHRNAPAGARERLGLLPNPAVEGDRQILHDDDAGPDGVAHNELSVASTASITRTSRPKRSINGLGRRISCLQLSKAETAPLRAVSKRTES